MKSIAIIDLGSNTTRMIIKHYEPEQWFKLTGEVSERVRLAEGVGEDGMLQPEPMQRSVEALCMFHRLGQTRGIEQTVAVATSALREATNQAAFLRALEQQCKLQLRILSSQEEAYYGYLGVINSVPLMNGFVIDIGGGSTEVAEVRNRMFTQWFSQQAGSVRFTERYVQSDPISKKDMRALEKGAAAAFAELEWMHGQEGDMLVGIGGTVRSIARIDQKQQNHPIDQVHGYVLKRSALDDIIDLLRNKDQLGRENIAGLNAARADVILAGAVILSQIMQQSGFEEIMVSNHGLRDGLFYEYFLGHQTTPVFENVREFSVLNLARLYDSDDEHAAKVREISWSLFDQLRLLHCYTDWERELLGYAALLHDIGKQINFYDHHKHSAYMVVNSAIPGFTHREIAMLTMLVRIHRKGGLMSEFNALLEAGDEERVARLGALLRLAEYLERGKGQHVQQVRVEPVEDRIRLRVDAAGDVSVEVWDANRRTALFKRAFGRDIEIIH